MKKNTVIYGNYNTTSANGITIAGQRNNVSANNATAYGNDNTVQAENSTALGSNSTISENATGSTTIGYQSEANEANVVSVGSASNQRRIVNVAVGTADTDAVNVKQLNDANADTLNSAQSYADDGDKATLSSAKEYTDNLTSINASDISTNKGAIADNGDAIAHNASDISDNANDIANNSTTIRKNTDDISDVNSRIATGLFSVSANGGKAIKVKENAVVNFASNSPNLTITQKDTNFTLHFSDTPAFKAITVGDVSIDSTSINAGGKPIHNIADGHSAHDAATFGQVAALANSTGQQFKALNNRVDTLNRDLSAGIAGTAALASIPFSTDAGHGGLGVGSGYYHDQSAIAAKLSYKSLDNKWVINGGASINTRGDATVSVGVYRQLF